MTQMTPLQFSRLLTLTGYFGLLVLLMLWFIWLAPPVTFPTSIVLLLFVGPLLLPLRGLLHGKAYTHAWASFLIWIYFIHGVTEAYATPENRHLALMEITFSVLMYCGTVIYARLKSREDRTTQLS